MSPCGLSPSTANLLQIMLLYAVVGSLLSGNVSELTGSTKTTSSSDSMCSNWNFWGCSPDLENRTQLNVPTENVTAISHTYYRDDWDFDAPKAQALNREEFLPMLLPIQRNERDFNMSQQANISLPVGNLHNDGPSTAKATGHDTSDDDFEGSGADLPLLMSITDKDLPLTFRLPAVVTVIETTTTSAPILITESLTTSAASSPAPLEADLPLLVSITDMDLPLTFRLPPVVPAMEITTTIPPIPVPGSAATSAAAASAPQDLTSATTITLDALSTSNNNDQQSAVTTSPPLSVTVASTDGNHKEIIKEFSTSTPPEVTSTSTTSPEASTTTTVFIDVAATTVSTTPSAASPAPAEVTGAATTTTVTVWISNSGGLQSTVTTTPAAITSTSPLSVTVPSKDESHKETITEFSTTTPPEVTSTSTTTLETTTTPIVHTDTATTTASTIGLISTPSNVVSIEPDLDILPVSVATQTDRSTFRLPAIEVDIIENVAPVVVIAPIIVPSSPDATAEILFVSGTSSVQPLISKTEVLLNGSLDSVANLSLVRSITTFPDSDTDIDEKPPVIPFKKHKHIKVVSPVSTTPLTVISTTQLITSPSPTEVPIEHKVHRYEPHVDSELPVPSVQVEMSNLSPTPTSSRCSEFVKLPHHFAGRYSRKDSVFDVPPEQGLLLLCGDDKNEELFGFRAVKWECDSREEYYRKLSDESVSISMNGPKAYVPTKQHVRKLKTFSVRDHVYIIVILQDSNSLLHEILEQEESDLGVRIVKIQDIPHHHSVDATVIHISNGDVFIAFAVYNENFRDKTSLHQQVSPVYRFEMGRLWFCDYADVTKAVAVRGWENSRRGPTFVFASYIGKRSMKSALTFFEATSDDDYTCRITPRRYQTSVTEVNGKPICGIKSVEPYQQNTKLHLLVAVDSSPTGNGCPSDSITNSFLLPANENSDREHTFSTGDMVDFPSHADFAGFEVLKQQCKDVLAAYGPTVSTQFFSITELAGKLLLDPLPHLRSPPGISSTSIGYCSGQPLVSLSKPDPYGIPTLSLQCSVDQDRLSQTRKERMNATYSR